MTELSLRRPKDATGTQLTRTSSARFDLKSWCSPASLPPVTSWSPTTASGTSPSVVTSWVRPRRVEASSFGADHFFFSIQRHKNPAPRPRDRQAQRAPDHREPPDWTPQQRQRDLACCSVLSIASLYAKLDLIVISRHQIEGIEGSYIRARARWLLLLGKTLTPLADYHESYFYLFTSWGKLSRVSTLLLTPFLISVEQVFAAPERRRPVR